MKAYLKLILNMKHALVSNSIWVWILNIDIDPTIRFYNFHIFPVLVWFMVYTVWDWHINLTVNDPGFVIHTIK